MSTLKRPITKKIRLSFRGNEPILGYCNNINLYNHFPIGLIIISKIEISSRRESEIRETIKNEACDLKIKYINQQATELFELNENDNKRKIHEQLTQFKQFDKNQITEKTLDNILFNSNRENEYYGFFRNQISLIYVKYKIDSEDLYICADYYTDERKIIQSQLFQTLKFQYIATLFHELYNPMNALLFMIDIDKNKQDISNSNCGNNTNCIDIDSSELSDNDNDNDNDNGNDNDKKNKIIGKLYKKKLNALNEKEKDIGLLVNMIYIFLQNLILYLRINLGVSFKVNNIKQNEENYKGNEKSNTTGYIDNTHKEKEKEKFNKNNDNIYSDNYLSLINKNQKLNLELSFCKHLDKFSYLFSFKNIHYCNDFSYLSDKYIITDESIFLDFLGQIYSFLYYTIPKSKGFDISYSEINDNKLKILFLKTNVPKKRGYRSKRSKRSRKSFSNIIGDDRFEAINTVKTSEMTQEILYKLSELLGIKLKIMEYEQQTEDIILTIILPFLKDNDKEGFEKNDNQQMENNKIPQDNNNLKINNQNQLYSLTRKTIPNKNINCLNPNFYKFVPEKKPSIVVNEIEEINSSQENISSNKKSNSKNLENDNISSIKVEDNKKKMSKNFISLISKSSKNNCVLSIKSSSNNISYNSNSHPSEQDVSSKQLNKIKEIPNNYLKIINPFLDKNDEKSNTNINKKNKNLLTLIHQKYSNIERMRASGVEILKEKESKDVDNKRHNKSFNLESLKYNDANSIINDDKKSITAEIDSDIFIEIENEEEEIKDDIKNNNNIIIINKDLDIHKQNNNLLHINYINKKESFNLSINDKRRKNLSNKPSDKTLKTVNNKGLNDNLFIIPELINGKINKKFKTRTNIKKNNKLCNCKDILVVDDDEFILKTSKNILKRFKLEADFAENGQECLNKIKEKQERKCNCSKDKYKLILMDITMPVMDGIEAAKNIQKLINENKLYDSIKIIFISAHVNLDLTTILSGIKCAVDYYAKPIGGDKYKSILDKYYYSK